MNPVFYGINIDTLFVLLHLFLLLTTILLISSFLLQGLQLLDFLRDKLVCLLQVVLKLVHGLVLILDRALDGFSVLGRGRLESCVSFIAVFLSLLGLISLLLHLSKLHLHCLQTRFLLKQSLLDGVFLLLLLTLLVVKLLLQNFHLLAILLLDLLRRMVVALRTGYVFTFIGLHLAHLSLDLLNPLRPGVLEQFSKIGLDLVNILLDSLKHLLFFLQACGFIGLLDRLLSNLITFSSMLTIIIQ